MKKYILVLLTAVMFTIFGLSAGEAYTDTDSPFPTQTPDNTTTFSVADLGNGTDHGVVFYNQTANTGSAVVLDSSGTPDSLLYGSAYMAVDYNLSPWTVWGTPDESNFFTSPYPAQAPDIITTYSAGDLWNGYNHAVMFFNQVANTAMLVVLDPNGLPDSYLLGYPFMAADFNATPQAPDGTIWYSKNGLIWYCYSGCPR